ncbi:hypothetical protein [Aquimarina latercula]|uniref:hypothetical protein n=1 Tax=Aquimarina latercula TaxID=987 RepID=UPI0004152722|nr:hypothetical protein [Aquimarina latercula]
MSKKEVLDYHFNKGQNELSDSIRTLIYKKIQKLFDLLDFHDDNVFLEPLLFGFFTGNHTKMTLEQILFGYIHQDKRPSEITVFVDKFGVIYLPKLGYLKIKDLKEKKLLLKWDKERSEISLFSKEKEMICFEFENLLFLDSAPGIELCVYSNPIYTEILDGWEIIERNSIIKYNSIPNYREQYNDQYDYLKTLKKEALLIKNRLEKSFSILKEIAPDQYQKYLQSTKKIFCFNNPFMRGFVTKNIHGTSFFSVESNSNETFFLDEVVHQCSHNVFNAITSNLKEYININPSTPLRDLIHIDKSGHEVRGFYDAFHGLYTVSTGVRVLTKVFRNYSFDTEIKNELLGRLAIKGTRFRTGIEKIKFEEVLTKEGQEIYTYLDESCYEILSSNTDIFYRYDFSNQPFVYSYLKFKEINELPK